MCFADERRWSIDPLGALRSAPPVQPGPSRVDRPGRLHPHHPPAPAAATAVSPPGRPVDGSSSLPDDGQVRQGRGVYTAAAAARDALYRPLRFTDVAYDVARCPPTHPHGPLRFMKRPNVTRFALRKISQWGKRIAFVACGFTISPNQARNVSCGCMYVAGRAPSARYMSAHVAKRLRFATSDASQCAKQAGFVARRLAHVAVGVTPASPHTHADPFPHARRVA